MSDGHHPGGCLAPLLAQLPERWRWTPHNVVAHPLGEALFQAGLSSPSKRLQNLLLRLADGLHDSTVPAHQMGEGRG